MPCPHGKKLKSRCRVCKGSYFCWNEDHSGYEKQKAGCRACKGSYFCWNEDHSGYEKRKAYCRACKGTSLCLNEDHSGYEKLKRYCKICDPIGHLFSNVRTTVYRALKNAQTPKRDRTIEYLGCTIYFYISYLEEKFKEGMTWENHGQGVGNWNIDHVIPLRFKRDGKPPTAEESEKRLYYTNTQPLWWEENMDKGNRYIG